MKPRVTSKEIHFLKTDSDDFDIRPPDVYLSDLLRHPSPALAAFEKRLDQALIPDEKFLCAAVRVSPDAAPAILETAQDAFENSFSLILDHDRGIWEYLDEASFILAFWDYDNEEDAHRMINRLKQGLSDGLGTDVLIGTAEFPYYDFTRSKAIANALKAVDHTAFFGPGTLTRFDSISLNISGDRLYHLNEYDLAIKEYEEGLRINPKDINLINSLGVCFAVSGNFEKARENFEAAMKIKPDELMVVYNTGLLYQIKENPEKAVTYLKKAHAINSSVFEVELLLGHLLFKQDEFQKALPHIESAGRLNPKSSLVFRLKGEIFLSKGEPEKAAREFNTAIKLNPSDAVSLSGYAKCLELQDKNLGIALSFAKNSISLEPDNSLFKERLKAIKDKIEGAVSPEDIIKTA